MANLLAQASTGLGLAQGSASVRSSQQADRADARARKEEGDQKLARLRATKLTDKDLSNKADIQSLELENLKAQQQQLLRANNAKATYTAFERFDATGEIRYINTMLSDFKKNGSTLYKDVIRLDRLTQDDAELIEQSGQVDQDILTGDGPASTSFMKATKADGSTIVVNLDKWKGGTDYKAYASTKELTRQKTAQEVLMLDSLGYDSNPAGRDAFRRARNEVGRDVDPKSPEFQAAYDKYYDEATDKKLAGRRGSLSDGLTQAEAYAKRTIADQGIQPGSPGYNAAFNEAMDEYNTKFSRPSDIRKQEAADVVREQLNELDILGKPYTEMNLKERAKVEPLISKLEDFSDAKLTTADKATLQRINELTALGDASSELTDDQTGIIDRVFRGVAKYISNNTEGVEQEAAYAAYRNLTRNALFGATLPANEERSFVQQFGSLGQQRGPILAQLRTSLEQVRSQYETLVQTNDPYIIAYRTGMTSNELQDVLDALDERIELVDNTMSGRTIADPRANRPTQAATQQQAADTVLTDDVRNQLDALRASTGGK